MQKTKLLAGALSALIVLSGCNMSNTAKGGIIGGGGGAVLGALIGNAAGNTAVGTLIGGAVGAGAGVLIGNKMDKAKKAAQQVENAQVETVKDSNGLDAVKVTFDSGILFATGKSTLSTDAKNSLSDFSQVLKDNADMDVNVYGYTDNQGWRNATATESQLKNKALSLDRAQAVVNYLNGLGVSYSQFKSVVGYGEENPKASNSTAAGQAENRRVEIYMYASQAMISAAQAQAK